MSSRFKHLLAVICLLLMTAVHAGAASANSPADAEKAFRICEGCHTMDGSTYQSIAPDLINLENRIAGTNDGFAYSGAMRSAGQDGLVWGEKTLLEFLEDPNGMVRGTKMKFKGIRDETERANLVRWLLKKSSEPVTN